MLDSTAARGKAPGLGTAGFVCGLLAAIFALVPVLNIVLAPILAIVGIVLGAIGMSQAGKTNAPKGLSVAGVALGVVSLIILVLMLAALFG
jgi:predicted tellurium resistance membrane protein TerC